MADPRLKQIKIKTGVVTRITKEKVSYEKETENEKKRLQKFKEAGNDDHVLRKQEEVVQESFMMIADCQKRLKAAHSDLQSVLDSEKDLAESAEYQAAAQALQLAVPHF